MNRLLDRIYDAFYGVRDRFGEAPQIKHSSPYQRDVRAERILVFKVVLAIGALVVLTLQGGGEGFALGMLFVMIYTLTAGWGGRG